MIAGTQGQRLAPILIFWCLCALGGCYTYVPVAIQDTPPGSKIYVSLAEDGTNRVEGLFGTRPDRIQGEVAEAARDFLVLTEIRLLGSGPPASFPERLVRLSAGEVSRVEVQQLRQGRSFLLASLIGAAVGLSFYFIDVVAGGDQAPRPPGGDFSLVPGGS